MPLIGKYKLRHFLDIPCRFVINEAVELTKSFGAIGGHKYVNGVLGKLAPVLRAEEVVAAHR